MKKWIVFFLIIVMITVPAVAAGNLVRDEAGLLTQSDAQSLEQLYAGYAESDGFTPVLVTTDSFGGISAEDYAGKVYDAQGYPQDGTLLLVSLTEGEWYILTNGACHDRISDRTVKKIGEELVPAIRDGDYYDAFREFPMLIRQYMEVSSGQSQKSYGRIIAICMAVGMIIGGIAVGVMAYQMKSVRMQGSASDYVRPGSMQLTNSRDIFLYSHVTRTAKPKNNSSGGSGGSRGGAGGKL